MIALNRLIGIIALPLFPIAMYVDKCTAKECWNSWVRAFWDTKLS